MCVRGKMTGIAKGKAIETVKNNEFLNHSFKKAGKN